MTAVFYFYIAFQVPYTGDDWDWGLDIGLQHLLPVLFLPLPGDGICTRERMQIIAQARETGAKEITLPAYPYLVRNYVWWGEPGEEYREVYFREFFGLEPDVEMNFYLE